MNNETLISIPLFVLMGYVMERGALVDKMFYSVQLAFRRVPASLAVATLIICTFWGIASGLVGAVVVLMGVIAMQPDAARPATTCGSPPASSPPAARSAS